MEEYDDDDDTVVINNNNFEKKKTKRTTGGGDSTGMTDVVNDGEHCAHGVHAQSEPPDELLVKLLLEVLEHQQANGEAGQGARYVRDVTHGRRTRRRLERVTAVHGEPDVHAGCGHKNNYFEISPGRLRYGGRVRTQHLVEFRKTRTFSWSSSPKRSRFRIFNFDFATMSFYIFFP